jgi:dihydroxyacid dehydratase/phosphogluconate dehydratase
MAGGANVMATLKQKMQTLRDELDVTKETISERNRQLEAEQARMNEVSTLISVLNNTLRSTLK